MIVIRAGHSTPGPCHRQPVLSRSVRDTALVLDATHGPPREALLKVNGEKLADWVRRLIEGKPVKDVRCQKCRGG